MLQVITSISIVEGEVSKDQHCIEFEAPSKINSLLTSPFHLHLAIDRISEWLGNGTGQSWCAHVSWGKMYTFDPFNGTEGIQNGRERVFGGEAALWNEQGDEHNIDALLW